MYVCMYVGRQVGRQVARQVGMYICICKDFPQVLRTWAVLQNLMGGGFSQYIWGAWSWALNGILKIYVKSLKNTCEGVHLLVKLLSIRIHIFLGFQLEFKLLFIVFQNFTSTYLSKDLLMAASLSTCNNSHGCIFNLREKYFPFLLFILTHSYIFYTSHRLTELNFSFFCLMNRVNRTSY